MIALGFFVFGLIVGSFLNVCIYRIPLNRSIIYPPSSCPVCGARIKWYDNIPLISYILLKGKCRNCMEPISITYPIVELLSGIVSTAVYLKYGLTLQTASYLLLSYALIVAAFIDLKHYIIPDRISLGLIVIGIAISYFLPIGLKGSIFGAIFGFVILYIIATLGKKVFKKEAMGGGDIKLLSGIGAFIGVKGVLFTLFVASLIGSVVGIILIAAGRSHLGSRLPFGPYLSLAAILYLFIGPWVMRVYGM